MKELPKESSRYGMISVHRTNSTGTHLVGSDIEHQQFITLKISTSMLLMWEVLYQVSQYQY